ncbi:MAG: hypothetical protein CMI60_18190 [Parvibaculum sp.]|nr:hypothetical protein [Parvibaculum sp.]|tara:strand:- start:1308 stop:1505 length:198 start_codon:yes stop_codon:yes gene_type:complete
MTFPNFEDIAVTSADGVATISLNRPEAANGMTLPMMQDLMLAASPDGMESINALLEKRAPNFTGA